jgi:hypothetical protein
MQDQVYDKDTGETSTREYLEVDPDFYSAAIYVTNRRYGGPEEGGWWYDVGEPALEPGMAILTRVFRTREDAYKHAAYLNGVIAAKEWNKHNRPPSSVACSGWYEARVEAGYPKEYPDERPHYE